MIKNKYAEEYSRYLDFEIVAEASDVFSANWNFPMQEPEMALVSTDLVELQPLQIDSPLLRDSFMTTSLEPSIANAMQEAAFLGYISNLVSAQDSSVTFAPEESVAVDLGSHDITTREFLAKYIGIYLPLPSNKGHVVPDYQSGASNGEAGFDILVCFTGNGWTESLQKAFINTADYFTSVIKGDTGAGAMINGRYVDDLYVSAELTTMDGVGGTLGSAGITNTWLRNDLTAAGKMKFDKADVTKFYDLGVWDDIVTHEFMHILGFGSLWNYGDHALATSSGKYTGAAALEAYNQATGTNSKYIPVETHGGAGTANSHWDEAALRNENMTGYTNTSGNYMSKYSVMSLADLGYDVRYKDYKFDNVVIG